MNTPFQRSLPFAASAPSSPDHANEEVAAQRAEQRLLQILPAGEESRISSMLEVGLHSAVRIAGMEKADFLEQWTTLYAEEEELGEVIYQNAVARRASVTLHHAGPSLAHEALSLRYITTERDGAARPSTSETLAKPRRFKTMRAPSAGAGARSKRSSPTFTTARVGAVDPAEGLYLAETYRRYQRPRDGLELARLRLGLSEAEAQLLFTCRASEAEVAELWDVRDAAELAALRAGEVPTVLRKLELSREQLKALLYQDLSDDEFAAGVAGTFFFNQDAAHDGEFLTLVAADPEDPTNPPDQLRWSDGEPWGLRQLDQVMRFTRLMRRLELSADELDWLLRSNLISELDSTAMLALAVAFELRARCGLPFEEVCALWATPKQHGHGDGAEPTALFDRIFNAGHDVSLEGVLAAGPSETLTYRLLAASRLARVDYATLTCGLAARGFTPEPTLAYAAFLYRMVALARMLDVRVGDLLDLLDVLDARAQPVELAAPALLAGAIARPSFHALAHPQHGGTTAPTLRVLQRVLALSQWANLRQLSARQLAYLCLERDGSGMTACDAATAALEAMGG